jgi:hypothetical protein
MFLKGPSLSTLTGIDIAIAHGESKRIRRKAAIIMRKYLKIVLIIWGGLLALCAVFGKAAVASNNAVTAADFLNIGVGARASGLGGAFTSVANDVSCAYWNPGGLPSIGSPQLIFSHFAWYQDISFDHFAASYPVGDQLTMAAGVAYMSYGKIDGYDIYDNPTGEVGSTYDIATGISAGYQLNDNVSVGLTTKYIVISLADVHASAVAADLGAKYDRGNFSFGLAIANIGSHLKFISADEKLPAALRVGAAVTTFGTSLLASLEIENQFYGDVSIKNGYEYNYEGRYFVRTGYTYFPSQDGREFGQSFAFGVGAYLGPARFDYTFTPEGGFTSESLHRLSIMYTFNR